LLFIFLLPSTCTPDPDPDLDPAARLSKDLPSLLGSRGVEEEENEEGGRKQGPLLSLILFQPADR